VVNKKQKLKAHRKQCLHCGFIWLARKKYPDWAKAGNNPHPQDEVVRQDMMLAVVRLASAMMQGMKAEDKKKFLNAIETNARPPQEVIGDILNSMFATKQ